MSGARLIKVGGREYTLEPLSFKALKEHSDVIRRMTLGEATSVEELFDNMASLVHASVSRSHPEITRDMVDAELDWPKAQAAVAEVLGVSFPQVPAGEQTAESPSGNSTGTPASAK